MHVDQPDAPTIQVVVLNEEEHLIIVRLLNGGQGMEEGDNLLPVFKVSARKLANDERMGTAHPGIQHLHEPPVGLRKRPIQTGEGSASFLSPYSQAAPGLFDRLLDGSQDEAITNGEDPTHKEQPDSAPDAVFRP